MVPLRRLKMPLARPTPYHLPPFLFLTARLLPFPPLRLARNTRYNYFVVRLCELLFVEFLVLHVSACLWFYLAVRFPPDHDPYSWIGSAVIGTQSYADFLERSILEVYCVSLYWAVMTMAGVGEWVGERGREGGHGEKQGLR